MSSNLDYINVNRQSWNNKVDSHLKSEFYNMEAFKNGKSSLNEFELDLLGDVSGKSILHLQCHFGQDSISLSRMGANVVGVDLSDKAIETARELSSELNADVSFICCDIYDLPEHLDQQFDVIYTTYGVIGWLPDLNIWAGLISHFLRPGGELIFVEFHPVVWMFDNDFQRVEYNYFKSEPIVETESGTYADKDADISQTTITWNHSIGEVITALLNHNLQIDALREYDYSPYNCFRKTVEFESGKFRIEHFENKIPMVYSVRAISTPA